MILESLSLHDFRNFQDVEIEASRGGAVIWGPNGRGKTNLLEAIFILGATRSHRTRKDVELIRFGCPFFRVSGRFRKEDAGRTTISLSYERNGRKRGRIDGKEKEKLSSMVGHCGVILVSPDDVEITGGEPEKRRQFLDLMLCTVDGVYLRALREYNRILRQRGSILRDFRERDRGGLLDPWDRQLAEGAASITSARSAAVSRLGPLAEESYGKLGGGEIFTVAYRPGAGEGPEWTSEQVYDRIVAAREEDLRTRRTSIGPHRDDLLFRLDDRPIRNFGSRGQHRTAVLALKLAAVELMKERLGDDPIVLLDDVFTELDAGRARRLADHLPGAGQVFATGTGRADLAEYFPGATAFSVNEEGGVVREI